MNPNRRAEIQVTLVSIKPQSDVLHNRTTVYHAKTTVLTALASVPRPMAIMSSVRRGTAGDGVAVMAA